MSNEKETLNMTDIENQRNILGEPIENYDDQTLQEITKLVINYVLDKYLKLLSPLIYNPNLHTDRCIYHVNNGFNNFNECLNAIKYLSSSFLFENKDDEEDDINVFFDEYELFSYKYTNNHTQLNIYNNNILLFTFKFGTYEYYVSNNPLYRKYSIGRFTYLIDKIKNLITNIFNEKMCEYIEITKSRWFESYIDGSLENIQSIINFGSRDGLLPQIKKRVIYETIIYVRDNYKDNMTELLKEDEAVTQLRDKYNLELEKFKV
jgi:hypothetical protein